MMIKRSFYFIAAILLTAAMLNAQDLKTEKKSFSILFAGDLAWGESYQDIYKKNGKGNILKEKGYDYTISALVPILSQADFVIANLETPVATFKESPFDNEKDYIHYADAEKTPAFLQKYNIKQIGLANNHTNDLGHKGLLETFEILKKNNIEYFGAGLDQEKASAPLVKEVKLGDKKINIYVFAAFEYRQGEYDEKYEFYAKSNKPGVFAINMEILKSKIAQIRKTDPQAFIIYFPHWGENYKWKNDEQTSIAHTCIENGVDLVIGHGAHMMQEIEFYQGKWIVYSIGNFMFNASGRYKKSNVDPFSLPAILKFNEEGNSYKMTLELFPIISDNKITNYQPRQADKNEFEKAKSLLYEHSPNSSKWGDMVKYSEQDKKLLLIIKN